MKLVFAVLTLTAACYGAHRDRGDDVSSDGGTDDGNPVGTPEAELTWQVDVRDVIDVKRAALACHASQAADAGMMLAMPPEIFAMAFGFEHYLDPAIGGPMRPGWPFGG